MTTIFYTREREKGLEKDEIYRVVKKNLQKVDPHSQLGHLELLEEQLNATQTALAGMVQVLVELGIVEVPDLESYLNDYIPNMYSAVVDKVE